MTQVIRGRDVLKWAIQTLQAKAEGEGRTVPLDVSPIVEAIKTKCCAEPAKPEAIETEGAEVL